MKIKSYYSRTVQDAIASARAELGPDAMLVNSRKAPIQARHLGEYEVVFATLPEQDAGEPVRTAQEPPPSGGVPAVESGGDRLSHEVAELKRELEGMRRVLTRTAYAPQRWTDASHEVSEILGILSAAEVAPDLAQEIVRAASERSTAQRAPLGRGPQRSDQGAFQRAIGEEIASRVKVEPALGRGAATPRIAAFVGPSGSGKTTNLVKMAVNLGLAARRPVLLLSMDTYRVAAAEQLRCYAAILGVGFQVLETVAALAQTIEENRGKELILIDTPGLGRSELDGFSDLTRFLATRTDIDTQLVLPASMKAADLTRMVDAFEPMRPARLLFTKLDETSSFGPLLNEAARTQKPLSFFSTGQRIPEDIENASLERLLSLVLGESSKAHAA